MQAATSERISPKHLVGYPHVALDQAEHRLVGLAFAPQARRRYAQPLLVDLGGVTGVATRHAAADIGHVRERHRVADQALLIEHRLNQHDVGQVRAAVIRVIGDEEVARQNAPGVGAGDRSHGERHGAQMERQARALRDQLAVRQEQRRREVERLLHHE